MRTRTLKKLLASLTTVLLIGAVAVMVLGLNVPVRLPDVQNQAAADAPVVVTQVDNRQVPELASLQKLARKDIRQRLFDPPPKPEPVIPPKPPPAVKLLGTIVNANNPRAMIAGARGQVELIRVGDTVGENGNTATIVEIHTSHIMIQHEAELVRVTIADDSGGKR